ncbi:universal stress protein [Desulfobacca acetoxidans]|uniref:UspA domain-containing protein n=1 Tax=Desulfobacca acetoxidans (strain ATCC 700848 / DSM 11109 / ASRB2) TaxID=880072 RepID=F2NIQ2_DESAR|nr:universal stress protein [Desulfobacca acetoxidans]AEB10527.1 UspA domain-containing protein [Desulfobacca acetoxidans DSM 11109]HAY23334.1 universal stress protein [Desulfobacterales bacterium]
MFKKILVPLDGSDLAAKILPQVEELAKMCGAQVTLITVGSSGIDLAGVASPEVFQTAAEHDKRASERYLQKVTGDLQGKGLTVNWAYLQGMPAQAIIKYADDNDVDLIALATHGKGEVAWVLGSTAEKVVSHATAPVLLIRVIEFKPPLLKEEFFMGA